MSIAGPKPLSRPSPPPPAPGHPRSRLRHLPETVTQAEPSSRIVPIPIGMPLDEVEQRLIDETLRQTKGDKELAAKLLGIASRTIYRKLREREDARADDPGA